MVNYTLNEEFLYDVQRAPFDSIEERHKGILIIKECHKGIPLIRDLKISYYAFLGHKGFEILRIPNFLCHKGMDFDQIPGFHQFFVIFPYYRHTGMILRKF